MSFIEKKIGGGRGGLVRRLLGILIGGYLGCGCLLTTPPEYNEPADYSPVFTFQSPASAIMEIDRTHSTVGGREIEVEVADGNLEQRLGYRWFLNFNTQTLPRCGLMWEYRESRDTAVAERDRTRLVLSENDNNLTVGECHRITLVVTDGDWLQGPGLGCAEVVEGANRLVADWWLLIYDDTVSPEEISFSQCHARYDSSEENPLAVEAEEGE